jgi:hypothetical protein
MTKFEIIICTLSLIIGAVIASIFQIDYNESLSTLAAKAIEECELNIPRNQHCTIVGVIKENK